MAVTGAAFGLLFAKWSSALLVQQLSTWESTVSLDLALDWRVLGFTAALACLSAITAGVAPVIGLRSVTAGRGAQGRGPRDCGRPALCRAQCARRRPDCRLTRPGRRGRTVPAYVCVAQPVAAWLRARAAARRGVEPPGERRPARGARCARRAPAGRGGGGARRAFGIGLREPAARRGRLGNRSWSASAMGRWCA